MATTYSAVAAAAKQYYRKDPKLYAKMSGLLDEMKREFGWNSRLFAAVGGPYVLWNIRQEEKRLASGWTYEPPTFYDVNDTAGLRDHPSASQCRYVTPQTVFPQAEAEVLQHLQDPQPECAAPSRLFQEVP
jgi:hypothetical protein